MHNMWHFQIRPSKNALVYILICLFLCVLSLTPWFPHYFQGVEEVQNLSKVIGFAENLHALKHSNFSQSNVLKQSLVTQSLGTLTSL